MATSKRATTGRSKGSDREILGGTEADEAMGLFFDGLANSTRASIVRLLTETDELSTGEIAEQTGRHASKASTHLAYMRNRGIVAGRRDAQNVYYRLVDPTLAKLLRDIRRRWLDQQGIKEG